MGYWVLKNSVLKNSFSSFIFSYCRGAVIFNVLWGFTPYQQYFISYSTATVHKSMFPGLLQPVLNQFIILTRGGVGVSRSAIPIILSGQGGKPLPVLKTFVTRRTFKPLGHCGGCSHFNPFPNKPLFFYVSAVKVF